MSILDYFPSPPLLHMRGGQKAVLEEVERVWNDYRFIIIEAAVGAGKSAIAQTIASWKGPAHLLTPMKSLQNQYHEDFSDRIVLMKGRSSYPCVFSWEPDQADKLRDDIQRGNLIHVEKGTPHCGNGPCKDSERAYKTCTNFDGEIEHTPCPYTVAVETAQPHPTIVHNLHSYIYQTNFGGKFPPRGVMIIDEGHRIEPILRDFSSFKVSLPMLLGDAEERERWESFEDIDQWTDYFTEPRFVPKNKNDADAWLARFVNLQEIIEASPSTWARFVVRFSEDSFRRTSTFELIPEKLGSLPERYLYSGGEKVIIMSGTVYDKVQFCKDRGIPADQAYMIRLPSTFPVESRPIIMKKEYMVDTSHKAWVDNLPEIAEKIKAILAVFGDAKGLIHAPSYHAAAQIMQAVGSRRLVSHSPEDAQTRLQEFYGSKEPLVYVSPTCQEGVDFKGDRARFQIIVRIPYLNAGDPFVSFKIANDFSWYNYQALITLGQQLGRINRSETDFGVTILMDSRFPAFIRKNKSKLPKWVLSAIKEK